MPEAHTLLTVSEGTSFGMPALDLGLARGDLALAGLEHLAHHDVLDLLGLDVGALERGRDRGAAQLGGVEASRGRRPACRTGCGRRRGSRSVACVEPRFVGLAAVEGRDATPG